MQENWSNSTSFRPHLSTTGRNCSNSTTFLAYLVEIFRTVMHENWSNSSSTSCRWKWSKFRPIVKHNWSNEWKTTYPNNSTNLQSNSIYYFFDLMVLYQNFNLAVSLGCGGGIVVSVLAYCSDDPSSIPAVYLSFFSICTVRKDKNKWKKRPGMARLKKISRSMEL